MVMWVPSSHFLIKSFKSPAQSSTLLLAKRQNIYFLFFYMTNLRLKKTQIIVYCSYTQHKNKQHGACRQKSGLPQKHFSLAKPQDSVKLKTIQPHDLRVHQIWIFLQPNNCMGIAPSQLSRELARIIKSNTTDFFLCGMVFFRPPSAKRGCSGL